MCSNSISKEKAMTALRVVTGFEETTAFIKANRSTPCKMLCAICRTAWARTGTKFVNLLFVEKRQFYICDNCSTCDDFAHVEKTEL